MASLSTQLRQTVQRLAGPAADQELYLRQLGTAPSADELALEFTDALMVEGPFLEEGVRAAAEQLDSHLAAMSGPQHAPLWTVDALHQAPEWERVRTLAAETLKQDDEHR